MIKPKPAPEVAVTAAEAAAFPGGCDVDGCPGHLGVSHVVAPSS